MPQIDDEKLMFIRGMISLAHVDGKYTIEEERLVNARVDAAALPKHQRDILAYDRNNPMAPMEVYNQIQSVKGKGILLSIARNLFHADGEFCQAEQAVMQRLESTHQQLLDTVMPKVREDLEIARNKANVGIMDARIAGKAKGGPFGSLLGWVLDR
jgi:uncharacterized membrane protein YebE (DUF533 family)